MKLSIVSTLYYSASYLEAFYTRVSATAQKITTDYEIILVNDGSPDHSLALAKTLVERDPKITLIDLSRNFGQHKAIMTGLTHAQGQRVFLIDSDLEEPPELLETFWRELDCDTDLDVIYGVQRARKGNVFERLSGALFYTLFNLLSSTKVERNVSVIRLMTQRYVKSLITYREQEIFLAGVLALTGYKQKSWVFDKSSKGTRSYTLMHQLDMLANSIASFSSRPLNIIFYIGAMITTSAVAMVLYYISRYVFVGGTVTGWTSLIVSLWALGGFIILSLGLIGIYLAKMFNEVKQRPYTIIRAIYRKDV